ncbi:MAG: preprotein translocase subunit SecG [Chitinophagaceae bacterium]|nr:preprotein translocase subunit SecG [Chitinophagaceae bacterium]
MTLLFVILVIVASIILGLIVLIQNPKGGGLAGSIAGFSNQFMGVKQTTDVLEKGTWVFGGIIAALCIVSVFFIPTNATRGGADPGKYQGAPMPNSTTPVDNGAVPFDAGTTPEVAAPDSNQ